MENNAPQPFNMTRLRAGQHLSRFEQDVLNRIEVLRRAPSVLKRLRHQNPDATIPDFAAHALKAHKEIVTGLAEERSWHLGPHYIDLAVKQLNSILAQPGLRGTAACVRLCAQLRVQSMKLTALNDPSKEAAVRSHAWFRLLMGRDPRRASPQAPS